MGTICSGVVNQFSCRGQRAGEFNADLGERRAFQATADATKNICEHRTSGGALEQVLAGKEHKPTNTAHSPWPPC